MGDKTRCTPQDTLPNSEKIIYLNDASLHRRMNGLEEQEFYKELIWSNSSISRSKEVLSKFKLALDLGSL